MAGWRGWNEFVSIISGGLLYGREVPRPLDESPCVRKRRPNAVTGKKRMRRKVGVDRKTAIL
jgi:hypothetical protein